MTFVHTLVSGLGAFITVRVMRIVKPASLSWDAYQAIGCPMLSSFDGLTIAFPGSLSFLFCINILFSNISLDYVSVSFHQVGVHLVSCFVNNFARSFGPPYLRLLW